MLNLHFSVKAFQSALAFLIFKGIIFLPYKNCLWQSSSKWHLESIGHFLLLKKIFSYDPTKNPRASILSNVLSKILNFSRRKSK